MSKLKSNNEYVSRKILIEMIKDITGHDYTCAEEVIAVSGLAQTFEWLNDIADCLTTPHGVVAANNPALRIYEELERSHASLQNIIRVLRLGKRYANFGITVAEQATKKAFRSRNRLAKQINRVAPLGYEYVMTWVIPEFNAILGAADWSNAYITVPNYLESYSLPTGATYDGGSSRMDKLRELATYVVNPCHFPTDVTTFPRIMFKHNQGVIVPKTATSSRFIAKEETYRTVLSANTAQALEKALYRFSHGLIDIHDQTRNVAHCRRAAVTGSYATIDLSAASDSISYRLASDLLGHCIQYFEPWRADVMRLDHESFTLHLFSTMGSRLTFPLETAIFTAVTLAACKFHRTFSGGDDVTISDIAVYGDDIIAPVDCVTSIFEFLTALGFTPNNEKSFYSEDQNIHFRGLDYRFRESCGLHVCYCIQTGDLVDVTPVYLPRGGMPEGIQAYPQLISLQHKLYEYPRVDHFLTQYLRSLYPEITESNIGSEFDDLWKKYPQISTQPSPFYDVETVLGQKYAEIDRVEVHTTFESTYRSGRVDARDKALAANFCITEYLTKGPQYTSPIDALLKVSTSRYSFNDLCRVVKTSSVDDNAVKVYNN